MMLAIPLQIFELLLSSLLFFYLPFFPATARFCCFLPFISFLVARDGISAVAGTEL
jgi:hypothetical protein